VRCKSAAEGLLQAGWTSRYADSLMRLRGRPEAAAGVKVRGAAAGSGRGLGMIATRDKRERSGREGKKTRGEGADATHSTRFRRRELILRVLIAGLVNTEGSWPFW